MTVEFCSAWFCPYAQRAWIALNHHKVPYNKIESLVIKNGGYEKTPMLLEKNPKGLVPTIIDEKKRVLTESIQCVEYVDELAVNELKASTPSLMPGDSMERALLRFEADWYNKNLCSPFYKTLMPTGVRSESFHKYVGGIQAFAKGIKGAFWRGDNISMVDIAVYPWAFRAYILEHYLGKEFSLEQLHDPLVNKFLEWRTQMEKLECVQATLADKAELAKTYERYFTGEAKSLVALAVLKGEAADSI